MAVDPEEFGGSDQDSHYMSQTSAKKLMEELNIKPSPKEGKVDAKLEVSISADGGVRAYYNDDVPELGKELGTMKIERASNIEWEDEYEGWTIRAAHDPTLALRFVDGAGVVISREGEMASFTSREEALKEEIHYFWELAEKPKPGTR